MERFAPEPISTIFATWEKWSSLDWPEPSTDAELLDKLIDDRQRLHKKKLYGASYDSVFVELLTDNYETILDLAIEALETRLENA